MEPTKDDPIPKKEKENEEHKKVVKPDVEPEKKPAIPGEDQDGPQPGMGDESGHSGMQ